jgi:hypothetical protein
MELKKVERKLTISDSDWHFETLERQKAYRLAFKKIQSFHRESANFYLGASIIFCSLCVFCLIVSVKMLFSI